MQARVEYDPRDQEAGEWCHETFFHQLPNAAIFLFIDFLEVQTVYIDNAAIDGSESVENRPEIDYINHNYSIDANVRFVYRWTYNAIAMNPFSGKIPHKTPIKMPMICLAQ